MNRQLKGAEKQSNGSAIQRSTRINPSRGSNLAFWHTPWTSSSKNLIVSFATISLITVWYFNFIIWKSPEHSRINQQGFVEGLSKCYEYQQKPNRLVDPDRENPRWNSVTGQQEGMLLRNATLFDGSSVLDYRVNILFQKGVIQEVYPSSQELIVNDGHLRVWDVEGRFVTPGLVDMHSHHLLLPFPQVQAVRDVNEKPVLGTLTPFVRAIDGFKAYDKATSIITSGGVTSSLILPGSGNLIGGEGYMVKNSPLNGPQKEPVVDDLLLEYGIPSTQRQRYMKMAVGENPKGTYGHTRMGNFWLLREHFNKAELLKRKQDIWCEEAEEIGSRSFGTDFLASRFIKANGWYPEAIELELTVAALRGLVNINVHGYEPQDIERLLSLFEKHGVFPQAFHHALEAWQIPELIKQYNRNITIATFADNALFKHEAYDASLRAGKILSDHGLSVAFKSDHTGEQSNAKYLMYQASVAHSFELPALDALRSVTSIPARSVQQDHRIGYVRKGYDADIVVWDDHPLEVGATPVQVFIDGNFQLDPNVVSDSLKYVSSRFERGASPPKMRPTKSRASAEEICHQMSSNSNKLVFNGIRKALLDSISPLSGENITLVVEDGKVLCLGASNECYATAQGGYTVALEHGYITPGLTALTQTLGLVDITGDDSTGNGRISDTANELDFNSVEYAKYGVHLDGRAFDRARIGGVTKAVTAPLSHGGLLQGVSVGITTKQNASLLDGGIFQPDVALHFTLGQSSKGKSTTTISSAIAKLRRILSVKDFDSGVYSQAANGSIPVVVHAVNKHEISQLIQLKKDYPAVKFVLYGGHGAPFVAKELAKFQIPVILTGNRGAPDSWEKRDSLTGPPLTPSPAQILAEEGVLFALAIQGDSHIQNLASEAGWAAKYAGLSETEAINLVSKNMEVILGLKPVEALKDSSKLASKFDDLVVWDGNPLKGEGSVVATIEQGGMLGSCWPDVL